MKNFAPLRNKSNDIKQKPREGLQRYLFVLVFRKKNLVESPPLVVTPKKRHYFFFRFGSQ